MRLHHIDAGTMRPRVVQLSKREGLIVDHVIVAETPSGDLAMVDSGIGVLARRQPGRYLGQATARLGRPDRDPAGSALAQIEALGRSAAEVRDIFMTHLDSDHASGLADFPGATVHVHHAELAAALRPASAYERRRYCAADWAHGVRWRPFGERLDSSWLDHPAQSFAGLEELLLGLPLPGHTRGHCGYALRADGGWLVHAGDAFYEAAIIDGGSPTRGLRRMERLFAAVPGELDAVQERLAGWARADAVTVVCTHDPALLAQLRN